MLGAGAKCGLRSHHQLLPHRGGQMDKQEWEGIDSLEQTALAHDWSPTCVNALLLGYLSQAANIWICSWVHWYLKNCNASVNMHCADMANIWQIYLTDRSPAEEQASDSSGNTCSVISPAWICKSSNSISVRPCPNWISGWAFKLRQKLLHIKWSTKHRSTHLLRFPVLPVRESR